MGPFWRYYGGKWRAAPRYPAPSFGLIVEPFAGAAGYASRYHDRDVLLIDVDPVIIGIWQWLIDATRSDVLSVPGVPEGGTVDDIDAPKGARDLVGFWCNGGAAQPRKTPSKWAQMERSKIERGAWGGWIRARDRVAADVGKISHWNAVCGDFRSAPDVPATWFIDPPYQTAAGRHYKHSTVDYGALGLWTLDRLGQVIACDQGSADWLPWTGAIKLQSTLGKSSEVVFLRDSMDLFNRGIH